MEFSTKITWKLCGKFHFRIRTEFNVEKNGRIVFLRFFFLKIFHLSLIIVNIVDMFSSDALSATVEYSPNLYKLMDKVQSTNIILFTEAYRAVVPKGHMPSPSKYAYDAIQNSMFLRLMKKKLSWGA